MAAILHNLPEFDLGGSLGKVPVIRDLSRYINHLQAKQQIVTAITFALWKGR